MVLTVGVRHVKMNNEYFIEYELSDGTCRRFESTEGEYDKYVEK